MNAARPMPPHTTIASLAESSIILFNCLQRVLASKNDRCAYPRARLPALLTIVLKELVSSLHCSFDLECHFAVTLQWVEWVLNVCGVTGKRKGREGVGGGGGGGGMHVH